MRVEESQHWQGRSKIGQPGYNIGLTEGKPRLKSQCSFFPYSAEKGAPQHGSYKKVNMRPIYGQLSAKIVTARRDKLETRPAA